MWKFSKDARKIVENVYTFFVEDGLKMSLERAWGHCGSDRSELSHCSENRIQEGETAITVDRWSSGHLALLRMICPNPLASLTENDKETDTADEDGMSF